LLIALALRAYQQEHGQYPDTLQPLAPDYLVRMPVDPFAPNQILSYHRTGETYVLYSVGPDRIDSGGAPIPDSVQGPNGETRYGIQWDSQGDIVAGPRPKRK
jgi:hypothetical protein